MVPRSARLLVLLLLALVGCGRDRPEGDDDDDAAADGDADADADADGDGDGDGDGDADTPGAIGDACARDGDCASGRCLLELPGGLCTQDCAADPCPSGSSCWDYGALGALCLADCAAPSDCREQEGYQCLPDGGCAVDPGGQCDYQEWPLGGSCPQGTVPCVGGPFDGRCSCVAPEQASACCNTHAFCD